MSDLQTDRFPWMICFVRQILFLWSREKSRLDIQISMPCSLRIFPIILTILWQAYMPGTYQKNWIRTPSGAHCNLQLIMFLLVVGRILPFLNILYQSFWFYTYQYKPNQTTLQLTNQKMLKYFWCQNLLSKYHSIVDILPCYDNHKQ